MHPRQDRPDVRCAPSRVLALIEADCELCQPSQQLRKPLLGTDHLLACAHNLFAAIVFLKAMFVLRDNCLQDPTCWTAYGYDMEPREFWVPVKARDDRD